MLLKKVQHIFNTVDVRVLVLDSFIKDDKYFVKLDNDCVPEFLITDNWIVVSRPIPDGTGYSYQIAKRTVSSELPTIGTFFCELKMSMTAEYSPSIEVRL